MNEMGGKTPMYSRHICPYLPFIAASPLSRERLGLRLGGIGGVGLYRPKAWDTTR